jgi:formate hydrogenlyase subunit 6/NADH:ubiquinone oxidoreductase subunit I
MHTSGHNPRGTQAARFRQRVLHKFRYIPERFQLTGCVGCGRCVATCPVNQDIYEAAMAVIAEQKK